MAFTNLYLIAGGVGSADINAGSSIGAAQATTTNGNWTSTTGVFIAASGTPFASTIVGDYASVYVDGATVTTFVGKVTVKTSSAQITVDIATIKYGTVPSTSATGRSCTINGSWNTEQVLAAGGLASTTVPQSTKINITGNLIVTANRTIALAGSAANALWLSAYSIGGTPGDLDNDTTNSLTKPLWTINSTFGVVLSGALVTLSGLAVTGSRAASLFQTSVSSAVLSRCRITNTSANAAAVALQTAGQINYCYLTAPTTATTSGAVFAGGASLVGCVIEGGGIGINVTTVNTTIVNCVLLNGVVGIQGSTAATRVIGCTFSAMTSDAIKWTGTPASPSSVIGCLFRSITGFGINSSGGTVSSVVMACNDFGPGFTALNGFGDSPAFFGQTDSSDPVTSVSNMTPVAGSNARNNGFPGIFENETFSSYADIGAVRHQDPSGFSGGIFGG